MSCEQTMKKIVKDMNTAGINQLKDMSHRVSKKLIDISREYFRVYYIASQVKATILFRLS